MEQPYNRIYLLQLAYKWKNGILTSEEKAYLENWDNSHSDEVLMLPDDSGGPEIVKARIFKRLTAAIQEEHLATGTKQEIKTQTIKLKPFVNIKWFAVAASIFIFLTTAIWLLYIHPSTGSNSLLTKYDKNISPGKSTATLTLANGKTINLSDTKTGVVIGVSGLKYNDNTSVISNKEKNLLNSTSKEAALLLTASTPRGGTYQITLPDGTQVWLNAASSIKFPSTFKGLKQRMVEIKGEAYFEVTKDKMHPFIVNSDGQQLAVLGTHFNINSYDKAIKTTLIEGSVSLKQLQPQILKPLKKETSETISNRTSLDNKLVILKPGQQSILYPDKFKIDIADTEEALAWKNGNFLFRLENVESIMRKISYWYDVEIVYPGPKPAKKISGVIGRNRKLSEVLNLLELAGNLKFKIEGRRIYVME